MLMTESPVVSVHIPPTLRAFADGHDEVMASGETVGDVLSAVGHAYPELGVRLLCRDGGLADGLVVYIGGVILREREGLATPVALEEVVTLVATGQVACAAGNARAVSDDSSDTLFGEESVISLGEN